MQAGRTIDLIDYLGVAEPERPAVIAGNSIVTFGMLRGAVGQVFRRLAERHLARGTVVAVWIGAPARHLAVSLALARLGLVSAPVADRKGLARNRPALVLSDTAIEAEHLLVGDEWFVPDPVPAWPMPPPDGDLPARIVSSSGTTGQPKPVPLTVANIDAHAEAHAFGLDLAGPYTRLLTMMDLVSYWGYSTALAVLSRGRTVCFAADAEDALRAISVYQCDYLVASVFQLRELIALQRRRPVPVPSLRALTVGGSIVPEELVRSAQAVLTQRVVLQYGSSELAAAAFEIVGDHEWLEGATGFLAPWIEAEVLDGGGNPLPLGSEGELRLRSRATADRSWFHPGDRALLSPEGRLRITGRMTDLINIGGVKVAPESIEQVLLTFPGIRDAGAIGVPGAGGLESVVAAIVSDGPVDFDALTRHAARIRAGAATPSRFVQVAAIPRGPTGKILRPQLREMLEI